MDQQVRRGRKFDQVLAGARLVFLRDGFEGASVDDIARAAGVSKATLYSYVPDKRLLFMEVAKAECHRQAVEAGALIDDSAPVEQVLHGAAERIMAFVLSDFGLNVFRICVAERDRFPGLGEEFYRSGPSLIRARLAAFLRNAAARGVLAIDDPDLAAEQFLQLCKADLHERLIFGVAKTTSSEARARVVEAAVQMFMARYRAG
ncbi:MAG: TetR/AcrR family transcriptional regulator [Cypionkella sp.]|nr:TetR/AcrR family transcriptional regulator [Cypionkella sp.]